MPKMKTRKTIAKRFRRTAGGKVLHKKAGRSHLLGGKSRKRKRNLRHSGLVSKGDMKRIGVFVRF